MQVYYRRKTISY